MIIVKLNNFLKSLIQNKSLNDIFSTLIIGITSIGLFVSAFAIDNNDSVPGRGFESAKVTAVEITGIIVLVVTIIYIFFLLSDPKESIGQILLKFFQESFVSFVFISLLFSSLIVSTFISPFQQDAIQGNYFRFQGIYAYGILFLIGYLVYRFVNKKNIHLINIAIISSGIFEVFYAFSQFVSLSRDFPEKLTAGIWVNGYYGQANFFSTHLVLAIVLCAYYLTGDGFKKIKDKKLKLSLHILTMICLVILVTGVIISFSEWGWITLPIILLVIIGYELLPWDFYAILAILGTITFGVFSSILIQHFPRYELRIEIWQRIRDILFSINPYQPSDLKYTAFGYGFDTLADVFKQFGFIKNLVIDRAHDIFFDILIQTGLMGFGFFIAFMVKLLSKYKQILTNRLPFYLTAAFLIWIFKSLVNEYSFVNFLQWIIVGACAMKITMEFSSKKKVEKKYPLSFNK